MFVDLIKMRRSIYSLGNQEILGKKEVNELVEECLKHCPSAFNSQSSRVVVLFEKHHEKVWDIVLSTLKPMIPAEAFQGTKAKVDNCFKSGYGTVLFFEDDNTTKNLQEQFPIYAANFPTFAEHASAMLQFAIWTAFAEKKIGATLQHYNPIIDESVKKEWNLPASWRLIAQMPFGSVKEPAGEKDFLPVEERMKTF